MSEKKHSDWRKYLTDKYFDITWPGSFQGSKKVSEQLKIDGFKVKRTLIQSWLDKQEVYALHKRIKKNFVRGRVLVNSVLDQFDCDLAFMPGFEKENNNFIGFILAVDVLSRKIFTELIKNKTPKEMLKCLTSIFKTSKPKVLRTDRGKEWDNIKVKQFLKKNNVKLVLSTSDFKANYAEAAIKTLKSRLFKNMTYSNTPIWYNKLNDIVTSYNNTVHSAHGFKPNNVTKENAFLVQYQEYKRRPNKSKLPLNPKPYKFSIGQSVRINYLKDQFHRQYHITFSGEIFKIHRRYRRQGIPVYILKEYDDSVLEGAFYGSQLIAVPDSEDSIFKIEKILTSRKKAGQKQFLIQWKYYPKKYNSWVFEKDIVDIKN